MEAKRYLEKVYGGLLGKCAGVRLGAPVEPTIWTYERIRRTYGEIAGYVKDYRNFAADDDINGPLFFIRTLIDNPGPVTARNVARSWLNYAREGIGFYWWGGYGRSTEHTAYLNLKAGIEAPASGCIAVNGATIAEQIGGQIFIDSWGWVFPDDPEKAAHYAGMAASVGHDRNGIFGARFIAACISRAFTASGTPGIVREIIEEALTGIPAESEYARVVGAIRDFYREQPGDWRAARDFLGANFGYDRYPGVCHIIPNAGVCALALYYGDGDFARSIEIATMCGWDTDCNAGSVGAILGVLVGPDGIPDRYRRPINDFHAAGSIAGALNIIDLPTASRELAILGLRQRGESVPPEWMPGVFSDDIVLDFSLPGSTSGIRTSSTYLAPVAPAEEMNRDGAVAVVLDRLVRGDTARIFYKPYYRREDFDDERYKPTFTPLAYPGQILSIRAAVERMSGQRIALAPYVRDARSEEIFQDGFFFPEPGKPIVVDWPLPEVPFAIDEVGLIVMNPDSDKILGKLILGAFSVTGKRAFSVRFADEKEEFGGLSRCSLTGGAWELDGAALHVITRDRFELYTGPYYTRDSVVEAELVPEHGGSHMVALRCRGAEYGYYFGFHGEGNVSLVRRDGADRIVASAPMVWQEGTPYRFGVSVTGNGSACDIVRSVDGKTALHYTDSEPHPYGMVGVVKLSGGRTRFISLSVREV